MLSSLKMRILLGNDGQVTNKPADELAREEKTQKRNSATSALSPLDLRSLKFKQVEAKEIPSSDGDCKESTCTNMSM